MDGVVALLVYVGELILFYTCHTHIFVLVLTGALFIYQIADTWSKKGLLWFRRLRGKLWLLSDCDGPYLLLVVVRAVFTTVATLAFANEYAFPI